MALPTDPPTHITLRIKVPPGHIEGGADEYTLANPIAVTSKIGALREQIQTSLPTNPAPERQRILYAGRALVDNDQTVADALNIRREPSQTEYVVHLLVRGRDGEAARVATPVGQGVPQQHGLAQHGHPSAGGMMHGHEHDIMREQQRLLAQLQRGEGERQGLIQEINRLQAQIHAPAFNGPPQVHVHGVPVARQDGEHPPVIVHGDGAHRAQQAQSNTPPQQGQGPPNAPPQHGHGQPHMQNVFVQTTGPNGERIAVHQQRIFQQLGQNPQHLNQRLPPGAHGLPPGVFGMHPLGFQNPPQQAQGPPTTLAPALNRAREQIAELQRLLDEVRAENQATPEQMARIARMQEQAREINSYIDPFNVGNRGNNANQPSGRPYPALHPDQLFNPQRHNGRQHPAGSENHDPANPPRQRTISAAQAFNPRRHANNGNNSPQLTGRPTQMPRATRVPPPSNPEDVTCYLLSDPTGLPQALLLTPQHGTFTGRIHNMNNSQIPQPPAPAPAQAPAAAVPQVALDQARVVRRAPANGEIAAANPMGMLIRHFWMLLRIMIFSYFFLGSNMGWRRPLALGAIALGFWLIRAGMLGDGAVVRGWWEDIVREGAAAVEPVRNVNANPGQMPTPQELADRLMENQRRAEGAWTRWARERFRAAVLLLASLWPGVGEGLVRAREAEDRRLAEEEVAEARRREEERVANEEAERSEREKREGEAAGATGETKDQAATGEQAPTAEPSTGDQAAVTDEKSSEASPSTSA